MGSTVGSVFAFVREMRLPVGIHLLTLLIKVAGGGELVFAHLRGSVHGALGGVEHEQVPGRGDLEVLPGDRDVFFIEPENPATGLGTDTAVAGTSNDQCANVLQASDALDCVSSPELAADLARARQHRLAGNGGPHGRKSSTFFNVGMVRLKHCSAASNAHLSPYGSDRPKEPAPASPPARSED
jgi:hypothetical protein